MHKSHRSLSCRGQQTSV